MSNKPLQPPVVPDAPRSGPLTKPPEEIDKFELADRPAGTVVPTLMTARQLLDAAQTGRLNPQDILTHLQARQMLAQALRAEQAEEEEARAAEAKLKMIEEQIREKLAEQAGCRHLKQNGDPCIGAQRVHSGAVVYICQRCSKEWRNAELPDHLAIDHTRVGGPA